MSYEDSWMQKLAKLVSTDVADEFWTKNHEPENLEYAYRLVKRWTLLRLYEKANRLKSGLVFYSIGEGWVGKGLRSAFT